MSGWLDNLASGFLRSPSMEMDERIPVEHFFNDYVSRLRSSYLTDDRREVRNDHGAYPSASGEASPFPLPGDFSRNFEEPQYSSNFGPASQQPFSGYPNSTLRSNVHDGNVLMEQNYYSSQSPDMLNPEYGNISSLSYETQRGMAGVPLDDSQLKGEVFMPQGETITTVTGSHTSATRISKPKHKSVRQQQLNKLAQQRYSIDNDNEDGDIRERKKAKAVGLEETVNALTEQLSQLSTVREEKLALEEKNLNLERRLIEKEAELQTVKNKFEESKKSSGANNSSDLTAYPPEERPKPVGTDSKVAIMFHQKVQDLKTYLKNNGLDQALLLNPLDSNVEKTHVDNIHKLVGDVCMVCMQLSRDDGPNLWDLISANLDSKKKESHDRSKWREITQALLLNHDQILSACRLREQHLMKLETIYIQRQNLNLEAIKLLLPSDHGGRGPSAQTLGCFSLASFIQRIRHTSKVSACLDKLKENLSAEQKLNSELEYMAFYRVMSPLQGAWFTVNAYPHQCDCLAFLNAVFELHSSDALRQQETGSN